MGEMRIAHKMLTEKPEGKRLLGRSRRRLKDNIKMNLRETDMEGVNWVQLAQDRGRWRALVNAVMNPGVLALRGWLVT
jgi:hypothetical protein